MGGGESTQEAPRHPPPTQHNPLLAERASLVAQLVESAYNEGDLGLIPELERSPGEGRGYPRRYSGLENFLDSIDQGLAERN